MHVYVGMTIGQFRQSPESLQLQFQQYQLQQQRQQLRQQALAEQQLPRKTTTETIQQQFQDVKVQQLGGRQQPLEQQTQQTTQAPQPVVVPVRPQVQSIQDLVNNNSSCVDPPFKCPHPRIQFFLYTR